MGDCMTIADDETAVNDTHKVKVEQKEAERRTSPSGRIVYKAILAEATDELARPSSALSWSGLAAGLSMGFSLITEGLLRHFLPDAPWRPLITKFGYSMGFLIVILGRQQLFTENTLTPILPLLLYKDFATFRNVLRLWTIVFFGNLVGGCAIAWIVTQTSAFEPEVQRQFIAIGRETMTQSFGTTLLRAGFAGWLIALMVWLLPFAEAMRTLVIVLITYLVGLGHFGHVIAGSINTFALAAAGQVSWGTVLTGFLVPTFLGNTIGGVTLVAALNHAQIVSGGGGNDV